MTRKEIFSSFDPNGVGIPNGNFAGLPFNDESAQIILLTAPWDVTTSYADGTASGPAAILDASPQLDLMDSDVEDAWKYGIYMLPPSDQWLSRNNEIRQHAKNHIRKLELGYEPEVLSKSHDLQHTNTACEDQMNSIIQQAESYIQKGKLTGLVGGDHSTPLGHITALSRHYDDFGILQIDAHADLRNAYEGFKYSHASIFYNALKLDQVTCLVQAGIRDYCEEEWQLATEDPRVHMHLYQNIEEHLMHGVSFAAWVEKMLAPLPGDVYLSIDIDGLDPSLCPNTGTPVPGGFTFYQAVFIIKKLVQSGRKIIGFDLCEVAGNEWDANVGARLLYKMCNLAGLSNELTTEPF